MKTIPLREIKKHILTHSLKKLFFVFLGTLFIIGCFIFFSHTASAALAVDDNLILNPSFEDIASGLPTHWQKNNWGSNTASFTYPVEGSQGQGSNAAQVTISSYPDIDPNIGGDAKWFFDEVTVIPGKFYIFKNKYTSTIETRVIVQYHHTNNTFTYEELGRPSPSITWQDFQAGFNIPMDVNSITIFHSINNVGTLTVDDYSLVQSVNPNAFSKGMVSLSFDDGWQTDYDNALPIINAAGFKSTHYIISNYLGDTADGYMPLSQVLAMQSTGYDIGAHTKNHLDLTNPATNVLDEVQGSRTDLLVNFSPVDTFAYPYGRYDTNVQTTVQNAGFLGARSVDRGYNDKATSRYALKVQVVERGGTCDGDVAPTITLDQIKSWIDTAAATNQWLILVFHQTSENSGDCYGDTPQMLQDIINYLKTSNVNVVTVSEGLNQMRSQTIEFGPLSNKIYGDGDITLGATSSAGLPVTFTATGSCSVSGNSAHIIGAGNCTVTAHQTGDVSYNAAPDVSQSFTIEKRNLTVSAVGINKVYDGNTSATVNLSTDAVAGDTIIVSTSLAFFDDPSVASGKPVHVTGISISGLSMDNYILLNTTAEAMADITLNLATIILDKTNLTRVYDGALQIVSVISTTPEGLSYEVTYNGSLTSPVDANTYTVLASITDVNYSGTDSATLIITKADQAITFNSLTQKNYGDADFSVSATSSAGLPVFFDAEGACTIILDTVHITGIGTCKITAHQAGNTNYNAAPDVMQPFLVSDTTPPIIVLNGLDPIDLTVGDTYTELGAVATDNIDLTDVVVIGGDTIVTTTPGTFHVTYDALDHAGNHAVQVVRTIRIHEAAPTQTDTTITRITPITVNPAPSGGSGGGGGSLFPIPTSSSTSQTAADMNKDGKVDILDFNVLMVNWGDNPTNSDADLNKDGKVDILDFNVLMVNWTI